MTDSSRPRRTLGVKRPAGDAADASNPAADRSARPARPARPVRVSDLNRTRVREAALARPTPSNGNSKKRDDDARAPARRNRDDSRPMSGTGRPPRDADQRGESRAPREARPQERGARTTRETSNWRGSRDDARDPSESRRPSRTPRPPRDAASPSDRSAPARPWQERKASKPFSDRPANRSDRAPQDRAPNRADRTTDRASERPSERTSGRPSERTYTRAPTRTHNSGDRPRQPPSRQRADAVADTTGIRLSKRMSELGLCSRREADEWIPRGWVRVNGVPVTELGTRIPADARIEIDAAARNVQEERVTILLHKPVGYVSGQAEDGYTPAVTLVTADNQWTEDTSGKRFQPWHRKSLAPAGRLDIDSTGLLVLTQDGRIAKALIGEDSNIEKEYLVRVAYATPQGTIDRDVQQAFPTEALQQLQHGLSLDGVALKPAKVSWQNPEQLRFVLREGKKRQIRRMCELVGLQVVGLKRVRMGRIALSALPPGQWRYLGKFEKF